MSAQAQESSSPPTSAKATGGKQALESAGGFTLLETVIATGILVTALAGIAQLFVLTARATRESGSRSVAIVAAQAKLETLRSRQLAYGAGGEPLSHPSLAPSPPQSLLEDTADYFDALDETGGVVIDDDAAASFVRRWSIAPLDRHDPLALVIEVCVFGSPAEGVTPMAAEACLSTIRSRQP